MLIREGFVLHFSTKDNNIGIRDYKIYTFNGEPKLFCINTNRGGVQGLRVNYFDTDFRELDFTWGFPHAEVVSAIPIGIETMFTLSRKLAKNTQHLRVDFYETNSQIYCGELTFFDGGGFTSFCPDDWDTRLGEYLTIHTK